MQRIGLITGSSRGLGRVLAHFLAAQGYDLVITARGSDALHDAQTELRRLGGQVVALPGDVTDPSHRGRLVAAAEGLGGLSLLVNNASDLGVTPLPPLAIYDIDRLRSVFEANVVAPLALTQNALPLLARAKGLIVNVSSDAAIGGYPGWGAYGASKAALDLVSKTLADELEDEGVAVVSVDPGDMRTEMQQAANPGEDISDRPLPEVTLAFWAWLLGQPPSVINGRRFQAQSDVWDGAIPPATSAAPGSR